MSCGPSTRIVSGAFGCENSSSSVMPSAFVSRHATAIVGLALSRSISESIDFDTPAARDRSSSVSLRSLRSRWICSPTRGGVAAGGCGAAAAGGRRDPEELAIWIPFA